MRCEECKFWVSLDPDYTETSGMCKRFPPLADRPDYTEDECAGIETCNFAVFPITGYKDWCGEFQPKKINNLKKGDTE